MMSYHSFQLYCPCLENALCVCVVKCSFLPWFLFIFWHVGAALAELEQYPNFLILDWLMTLLLPTAKVIEIIGQFIDWWWVYLIFSSCSFAAVELQGVQKVMVKYIY